MSVVLIAVAASWMWIVARRQQRVLEPARRERPWRFAVVKESAEFLLPLALAAWTFTLLAGALLIVDSPETTYATLVRAEAWRARLVAVAGLLAPGAFAALALALGAYLLLLLDNARLGRVPRLLRTYRKWVGRAAKLAVALGFFTLFSGKLQGSPYDLAPRLRLLESTYSGHADALTRDVARRVATRLADSVLQRMPPRQRALLEQEVALRRRVEELRGRVEQLDPRAMEGLSRARRLLDSEAAIREGASRPPRRAAAGVAGNAEPPSELTEQRALEMQHELRKVVSSARPTASESHDADRSAARREVIGAITEVLAEILGFTVPRELAGSASRLMRYELGGKILQAARNVVVKAGLEPRVERMVDAIQRRAIRTARAPSARELDEAARGLDIAPPRLETSDAELARAARQEAAIARDVEQAEREVRAAEDRSLELLLRDKWDGALAALARETARESGRERAREASAADLVESRVRQALASEGFAVRDAFYTELERLRAGPRRAAIDDMRAAAVDFTTDLAVAAALTLGAVGQPVPRAPSTTPVRNQGVSRVAERVAFPSSQNPFARDSRPQALREAHARVARRVWGVEIEEISRLRKARDVSPISIPVLRDSREHLVHVVAANRREAELAAKERQRIEAEIKRTGRVKPGERQGGRRPGGRRLK